MNIDGFVNGLYIGFMLVGAIVLLTTILNQINQARQIHFEQLQQELQKKFSQIYNNNLTFTFISNSFSDLQYENCFMWIDQNKNLSILKYTLDTLKNIQNETELKKIF